MACKLTLQHHTTSEREVWLAHIMSSTVLATAKMKDQQAWNSGNDIDIYIEIDNGTSAPDS